MSTTMEQKRIDSDDRIGGVGGFTVYYPRFFDGDFLLLDVISKDETVKTISYNRTMEGVTAAIHRHIGTLTLEELAKVNHFSVNDMTIGE